MLFNVSTPTIKKIFIICFSIFFLFSCKNASDQKKNEKLDSTKITKRETILTDTSSNIIDSTKKYIYLTFDDGPQPGTLDCEKICKDENVKATFFVVGLHAMSDKNSKQIVKNLQDQYPLFLVANHSYTHAFRNKFYKFYGDPIPAFDDFVRCQDSLQFSNHYTRLPGNDSWSGGNLHAVSKLAKAVVKKLDTANYIVVGWEAEWRFKNGKIPIETPEQMLSEVEYMLNNNHTKTKNHIVILSHDRMFHDVESQLKLITFIKGLKQHKDYVFQTIDKYPFTAKRKLSK